MRNSLYLRLLLSFIICHLAISNVAAQGWPANYSGVMLQGFYWDSFTDTRWRTLESQADELSNSFSLIWIPQSGKAASSSSMGYDPLYFYNQNSSFGNETELKSMINTFKGKGLLTIADIVVNHRGNVSNWVDFPTETNPYDGKTYQMNSTDIVANDDGGATNNWAKDNGYQLSSNNDTGEDFPGLRDLDHKSENVYFGEYNKAAAPQFSVGEYWDGNASAVKTWINGTKVDNTIQSAAFDFPFRYTVRDAINNNDWTKLGGTSVMSDTNYRRYSVTFVENHDTERRANAAQDPITRDTLAANAFLLGMPGTPCVFLKHWQAYKPEIAAMIAARKVAGITNTSAYLNMASNKGYYVNLVNSKLLVAVGNNVNAYTPPANYIEVLSGYHYRYFLHKNTETAWADKASGEYNLPLSVKLSAISADANAQLVYTLDGSEPTASSTKVASGTSIEITGACTLKVGLLIGSTVSSIITREFTINSFQPYDITIYVNTDKVGWSNVNFWTWGGDGTHAPTNSNWPGDKVSSTTTINGKQWYAKTYTINSNFVFSTGTGSPQTIDINDINETTYFEISTDTEGGKNKVNDVTSTTGIEQIMESQNALPNNRYYNLNGQQVKPIGHGIYIKNGKKYVK